MSLGVGLEDCGGLSVFDWDAINVVAVIVIEEEDVGIAQAGSGRELAGLVDVGFSSRESMDSNKTIVSYRGGRCFLWEGIIWLWLWKERDWSWCCFGR